MHEILLCEFPLIHLSHFSDFLSSNFQLSIGSISPCLKALWSIGLQGYGIAGWIGVTKMENFGHMMLLCFFCLGSYRYPMLYRMEGCFFVDNNKYRYYKLWIASLSGIRMRQAVLNWVQDLAPVIIHVQIVTRWHSSTSVFLQIGLHAN